jgi:hypothetical protein
VRKPGKKATKEQKAAYRQAKKTHNLSTAFVALLRELRQCFDWHDFQQKLLIAVGDGSSNPDRRSCNPLVWFPK